MTVWCLYHQRLEASDSPCHKAGQWAQRVSFRRMQARGGMLVIQRVVLRAMRRQRLVTKVIRG